MQEFKPGIPDHRDAFSAAMKQHGIPQATIDSFLNLWFSLPPHAEPLPCPFCYHSGGWGALVKLAAKEGVESVGCKQCRAQIVVSCTT